MEIHVRGVVAPVIGTILAALLVGCSMSAPPPSPSPFSSKDTITVADDPVSGLSDTRYVATIEAVCSPPIGWTTEPIKSGNRHMHQVWVSPSGHTAYGVIHFTLPLPVGTDPVLWVFMSRMRHEEGEAKLLSKQYDSNLNGVRFVAQGGLYTVRTNLLVRGFDGWAIYAGTHTTEEVVPEELALAERARERTQVGIHRNATVSSELTARSD